MLENIKLLIESIQLKLSLKKDIDNVHKDITIKKAERDKLKAELDQVLKDRDNNLATIQNEKDINKSLHINLISKEVNKKWHEKLRDSIFRFDGYIFYLNKAEDLKIYRVKNFKMVWELQNLEMYNLNKKVGTFRGKPFFLIKYPIPTSLDITNNLMYDAKSFYNFHNKLTKGNLTDFGASIGFGDFIRKNIILIIILIALAFLFFTPQGKEFLSGILPKKVAT